MSDDDVKMVTSLMIYQSVLWALEQFSNRGDLYKIYSDTYAYARLNNAIKYIIININHQINKKGVGTIDGDEAELTEKDMIETIEETFGIPEVTDTQNIPQNKCDTITEEMRDDTYDEKKNSYKNLIYNQLWQHFKTTQEMEEEPIEEPSGDRAEAGTPFAHMFAEVSLKEEGTPSSDLSAAKSQQHKQHKKLP